MDEKIKNVLDRLSKSKFRSGFHLKDKDMLYIKDKGVDKIREHAYDFISKRIVDTSNVTDGKQTPMRGHPVFIAQHATGTCCRGCLEKWHHINKNKKMDNGSSMYIDYLGMGDAWNIKADEANGLYSFKATDDKILDVMKALANQISGRIEVDSSNITQVDKKTVKVHSELPLYSLSVLSQESDAKVLSAKAENELDVERNISLNATDLKNGIKKHYMISL